MSLKAQLYVHEQTYDSPAEKLVMLEIANVADDDGRASIAIDRLALYANEIDPRYCKKILDNLGQPKTHKRKGESVTIGTGKLSVKVGGGYDTAYGRMNLYIIVGVADWLSPLPNDPLRKKITGEKLTYTKLEKANSTKHKKTRTVKTADTAIGGQEKQPSEHQQFFEVIIAAYKSHPGATGGLGAGLAGKMTAMFRGVSKTWKIPCVQAKPFTLLELRAFFLWSYRRNETLPITNLDNFEQRIINFRSAVNHDELIREIEMLDRTRAAREQLEQQQKAQEDALAVGGKVSPERAAKLQARVAQGFTPAAKPANTAVVQ